MKLIPLIGALLLSTAPVQAIETWDELDKRCQDEGVHELCEGSIFYGSALSGYTVLCGLSEQGSISPEVFADRAGSPEFYTGFEKHMWNVGLKDVLKQFPNCPIKLAP